MLASRLVVGGLLEKRIEAAQEIIQSFFAKPLDIENPPIDVFLVRSTNSIGIGEVRNLKKFLSRRPYQAKIKVGLILEAEKLTLPAQNSLLKTLEEPPENSLIVLLASQKENLLPTIISRVKITRLPARSQIHLSQEETDQLNKNLKHLLVLGAGERIKESMILTKDKHQALALTENLLFLWREALLVKTGAVKKKPSFLNKLSLQQIKKAIKNTEQVRKMLAANVNFHLAIENLFLSYPHLS